MIRADYRDQPEYQEDSRAMDAAIERFDRIAAELQKKSKDGASADRNDSQLRAACPSFMVGNITMSSGDGMLVIASYMG
ncbi:hypothetical protein HL666_09125 [Bradyrhizobium sp. 83002]|uniref:hypothetical protein n=1 Tax=Bradyrhizobium aeschynomenes TaxID=2734909 RepID=UPI001557B336|nr:hypothetical protein [Bradyrhizobium aeschynomenes]NPU10922.1 hypothetical protein [Bradyrhizobium aeschynomenes]